MTLNLRLEFLHVDHLISIFVCPDDGNFKKERTSSTAKSSSTAHREPEIVANAVVIKEEPIEEDTEDEEVSAYSIEVSPEKRLLQPYPSNCKECLSWTAL